MQSLILPRRTFLAAAPLAVLPLAAARAQPMRGVPPGNILRFKVLRGDSAIGTQVLHFTPTEDGLGVTIAADFAVRFGPIVFYRYKLLVAETWQASLLRQVEATADDGGKKEFMHARREDGALAVDGSATGKYRAPPGAIAATHWNRAELNGPMINPEDGTLLRFTVTPRGAGSVPGADGKPIAATRYDLTGPAKMTLWYDATEVWCGVDAVAKDGSLIHYRRVSA